ncbi:MULTISPECIES: hypothetical protein [Actinomadura]|uniref:Uncharacterized protein n=1 Tax=Actinomadura yumaensis TaxID=111807 RepID=A0ABW2CP57_9ACTN|nr:hypothetical protein [Actinomadura sp. J1-007]MWK34237.1 hypothetical protein [Actinomadura sp. J1-007]
MSGEGGFFMRETGRWDRYTNPWAGAVVLLFIACFINVCSVLLESFGLTDTSTTEVSSQAVISFTVAFFVQFAAVLFVIKYYRTGDEGERARRVGLLLSVATCALLTLGLVTKGY